jgi:hypothetical protein
MGRGRGKGEGVRTEPGKRKRGFGYSVIIHYQLSKGDLCRAAILFHKESILGNAGRLGNFVGR